MGIPLRIHNPFHPSNPPPLILISGDKTQPSLSLAYMLFLSSLFVFHTKKQMRGVENAIIPLFLFPSLSLFSLVFLSLDIIIIIIISPSLFFLSLGIKDSPFLFLLCRCRLHFYKASYVNNVYMVVCYYYCVSIQRWKKSSLFSQASLRSQCCCCKVHLLFCRQRSRL